MSPSGGQRQRQEGGRQRGRTEEPAWEASCRACLLCGRRDAQGLLRAPGGAWGLPRPARGFQLSSQAEALSVLFPEDPCSQLLLPPLSCGLFCWPPPCPPLLLISDVSRQGRPFLPGEGSELGSQRRVCASGHPRQGRDRQTLLCVLSARALRSQGRGPPWAGAATSQVCCGPREKTTKRSCFSLFFLTQHWLDCCPRLAASQHSDKVESGGACLRFACFWRQVGAWSCLPHHFQ